MKKIFKRSVAAVMAVASLAFGMVGVNAGAEYQSMDTWRLFIVNNDPEVPNQARKTTCNIPAYSGGYQSHCINITGSNDRKVDVTSNVGLSWTITQTGYSSVHTSKVGGTATFTFTASATTTLTSNGTIGYDIDR